jgi:hypothetical protein
MPLCEESAFIVAEREALPGGFRGTVTTTQSRGNIRGRGAGKGKGKKRKANGTATFVLPDLNEQADEIQVTQNAPV